MEVEQKQSTLIYRNVAITEMDTTVRGDKAEDVIVFCYLENNKYYKDDIMAKIIWHNTFLL